MEGAAAMVAAVIVDKRPGGLVGWLKRRPCGAFGGGSGGGDGPGLAERPPQEIGRTDPEAEIKAPRRVHPAGKRYVGIVLVLIFFSFGALHVEPT